MDLSKRAPGAHSRMTFTHERQLTLGECIAIARYGASELDAREGPPTVGQLLDLLDRLEVCTTCGWSRALHESVQSGEHFVGLCEHYDRHL